MTIAIILDTETNDKEGKPDAPLEVIELAWISLDGGFGGFSQRYKPNRPPAWGALAAHHILMSELEGCPPSSQAPSDLPNADYWIGHNIDFDWKALGQPPVRRICTLALARSLWPELDSHTLSALMYYTQGATPKTRERLRNAHAATADCEFVLDILQTIMHVTKTRELEPLWQLSEEARIPKVWTFGKFEDEPIGKADRGYAGWFQRTCVDRPDYQFYLVALKRAGLLR